MSDNRAMGALAAMDRYRAADFVPQEVSVESLGKHECLGAVLSLKDGYQRNDRSPKMGELAANNP